jgi:hypothetical protein
MRMVSALWGIGFFELEVAGPFDRRVSETVQDRSELQRLIAQCDHVEKEVDIFRSPRPGNGEFHGLRTGEDEIIRRAAQRGH